MRIPRPAHGGGEVKKTIVVLLSAAWGHNSGRHAPNVFGAPDIRSRLQYLQSRNYSHHVTVHYGHVLTKCKTRHGTRAIYAYVWQLFKFFDCVRYAVLEPRH